MFDMIAAISTNNGIGKDGKIPWHIPNELKYFKKVTDNSVVIMGRNTWESLPVKPLKNRLNIVISSSKLSEVLTFETFDKALVYLKNCSQKIFVIGGEKIYNEGIRNIECNKLYITHVDIDIDCDKYFPKIDDNYQLISQSDKIEENGFKYKFCIYQNSQFNTMKN